MTNLPDRATEAWMRVVWWGDRWVPQRIRWDDKKHRWRFRRLFMICDCGDGIDTWGGWKRGLCWVCWAGNRCDRCGVFMYGEGYRPHNCTPYWEQGYK